ncbi:DUF3857 domain-containing protein [Flavobacterium wongokense]|uniref:DUF3857 domain-containing protein n=1 Tax=Flavobacterium wongokense TaxID=2910674 RepID=UPI001F254572|nr:DUF3857 domain-containing protein [Flavobacterium sp. WG47]MCF6133322.1 DUF3857 and transglutaminase domain-containing protein [Flavobacterium sp. WG47]
MKSKTSKLHPAIVIAALFLSVSAFAQKKELGKVTLEELNEKVCPTDTSAAAAVLFKKSQITFDSTIGQAFVETEVKIKIYKKEAYDYANVSEAYYTGNNEKLNFSNVATYNVVNGQIVKTKLKKEGDFKEEMTKDLNVKKIVLSDVKEGSIIEYKITRYTNNVYRLVNFYFQEGIPVNDVELKVEYSDLYFYNKSLTGFLVPEIKEEIFNLPNLKSYQHRIIYKLKNVPAMKDEDYVNNINNYRARIRYELASVKNSYGISENLATDWESVVKRVYDSEYFGTELKKTGYFEKDVDALLTGLTTQQEKINAIFNYVKSKVTWDEYYGFACNDGVKKAYQEKKGNTAEINLMLTAMLRYAGIDANPILLSTRANGLSVLPSITAFNYVICGIELTNQVILLDATNKYAMPDILPIRDLNWFGRIIRKNGSSADIDLMPKLNSKDIINILAKIEGNGEIKGKIREQYFDYNALAFRQANNATSKDAYLEKLEKDHQGLEIGEYNIVNKEDLTLPVIENYDFTATNSVEIIGDKMYLSPFLFFAKTENPFKQEIREYPVDFVFPNQDKFNISLTIPEGYAVELLPTAKAVSMIDDLANFKYNISTNGSQIQILYTYDINQAIIGSEHYETLKNFYKEMINKQTEKIVLKKV